MWLVLCNSNDLPALWAGQGLRSRGIFPLEFVTPIELACSSRLEYRAENGEPAYATAELSGGRRVDTRRVAGTLNRAARADFPQVHRAIAADRAYVRAEMDAILLAWLGALKGPIYNPPDPTGWAGVQLHPFSWALKAQQSGFATKPYRSGRGGLEYPAAGECHHTSHLVFEGKTFPALPAEIERAATVLAANLGLPLLGITLWWMPDGEAIFASASSMPDLRAGGEEFLNALATTFSAS